MTKLAFFTLEVLVIDVIIKKAKNLGKVWMKLLDIVMGKFHYLVIGKGRYQIMFYQSINFWQYQMMFFLPYICDALD